MAIEIVDLPVKNGDFPYKSPFSHCFPLVFLLKMVIFHSYVNVYQRVVLLVQPTLRTSNRSSDSPRNCQQTPLLGGADWLYIYIYIYIYIYTSIFIWSLASSCQDDKPTYLGHYNIWVNYKDLTVLPNPGIMVSIREIIPKWPQDSG